MALTKVTNRMTSGGAVNVKDYGAIGDGVTDDTAAITAALTVGNEVVFPPGTYVTDSQTTDLSTKIVIMKGAIISVNSGEFFQHVGDMDAGLYKIFAGAGSFTFANSATQNSKVKTAYPEWWGAISEITPTAAQNTINADAITSAMNTSGVKRCIFTNFYTVDRALNYKSYISVEGLGENFHDDSSGINFKFTASGNTSLFSPLSYSQNFQMKNMHLSIDAASDLGTSGWDIILHNHKGGRYHHLRRCYFKNNAGADNGGGNYRAIGSHYEYTVNTQTGYIFDIWMENNFWTGFDIGTWANGDNDEPAAVGKAVSWFIYGNRWGDANSSNTNAENANLRIDWGESMRILNNDFTGKGMTTDPTPTGTYAVILNNCLRTDLFNNSQDGAGNGLKKYVFKGSSCNWVNTVEASIYPDDDIDVSAMTGVWSAHTSNDTRVGRDLAVIGDTTFSGDTIIATKTPASASATGVAGEIAWDSSWIYICVATDTWKKAALATW